jgi:hypothetical protein
LIGKKTMQHLLANHNHLARRISDGAMLELLKKWLQMPVEESDGRGGKRRSNPARYHRRGTPQGAPISPLLANQPFSRCFGSSWSSPNKGMRDYCLRDMIHEMLAQILPKPNPGAAEYCWQERN